MSDNKNNNLIEEIDKVENKRKAKRPRPRQSKRADKVNELRRLSSEEKSEKRKSIGDILDMIGATNGATFVSNGEKDGKNSIPENEFLKVIQNIISSAEKNNQKEINKKQDQNRDNSFVDNIFGEIFEDEDCDDFYEDDDEEEDSVDSVFRLVLGDEGVDMCPPVESILKYLTQTRPFGIEWEVEKVVKFLRENGYTIYKKKNSEGEYMVAFKQDVTEPVEKINKNNLGEEFSSVIQDILLNWLTRIK